MSGMQIAHNFDTSLQRRDVTITHGQCHPASTHNMFIFSRYSCGHIWQASLCRICISLRRPTLLIDQYTIFFISITDFDHRVLGNYSVAHEI